MTPRGSCYVCGSAELAAGADLRNPTCARCLPAREHVVSMARDERGNSVATCACGWSTTIAWVIRHHMDDLVGKHWHQVVEQAG